MKNVALNTRIRIERVAKFLVSILLVAAEDPIRPRDVPNAIRDNSDANNVPNDKEFKSALLAMDRTEYGNYHNLLNAKRSDYAWNREFDENTKKLREALEYFSITFGREDAWDPTQLCPDRDALEKIQ
jgi:hypothetical protein